MLWGYEILKLIGALQLGEAGLREPTEALRGPKVSTHEQLESYELRTSYLRLHDNSYLFPST